MLIYSAIANLIDFELNGASDRRTDACRKALYLCRISTWGDLPDTLRRSRLLVFQDDWIWVAGGRWAVAARWWSLWWWEPLGVGCGDGMRCGRCYGICLRVKWKIDALGSRWRPRKYVSQNQSANFVRLRWGLNCSPAACSAVKLWPTVTGVLPSDSTTVAVRRQRRDLYAEWSSGRLARDREVERPAEHGI